MQLFHIAAGLLTKGEENLLEALTTRNTGCAYVVPTICKSWLTHTHTHTHRETQQSEIPC
jgi:hypothetical protein